MNYPANIWNQLKNISADELKKALEKDGWKLDGGKGSVLIYRHSDGRRVSVHYHPIKTFGPNLLKALFDDIEWTEEDLKRLKLIK